MRFVLTALAMIGGIVFTLIGLGFFFQPQSTGESFALLPDGVPGLAVMRADMTAFFVVGRALAEAPASSSPVTDSEGGAA